MTQNMYNVQYINSVFADIIYNQKCNFLSIFPFVAPHRVEAVSMRNKKTGRLKSCCLQHPWQLTHKRVDWTVPFSSQPSIADKHIMTNFHLALLRSYLCAERNNSKSDPSFFHPNPFSSTKEKFSRL